MNLKNALITCIIVVLYLSLCSWRFASLNENEVKQTNELAINVK